MCASECRTEDKQTLAGETAASKEQQTKISSRQKTDIDRMIDAKVAQALACLKI